MDGQVRKAKLVGMVRLELTCLSTPEPKSGAAANYATSPINSKNPLPEKYLSLNSVSITWA